MDKGSVQLRLNERDTNLSRVVHNYVVERGWSGAQ
jgi:hypothetical protein